MCVPAVSLFWLRTKKLRSCEQRWLLLRSCGAEQLCQHSEYRNLQTGFLSDVSPPSSASHLLTQCYYESTHCVNVQHSRVCDKHKSFRFLEDSSSADVTYQLFSFMQPRETGDRWVYSVRPVTARLQSNSQEVNNSLFSFMSPFHTSVTLWSRTISVWPSFLSRHSAFEMNRQVCRCQSVHLSPLSGSFLTGVLTSVSSSWEQQVDMNPSHHVSMSQNKEN